MHPALWKLYRLRARGVFRALGCKVKTVRGALMAAFALLMLGMMFVPNMVIAMQGGHLLADSHAAHTFREMMPLAMLVYLTVSTATSLGERAIYFSPSDVDFLFPAPFSRRQLLLFKILGGAVTMFFVAICLTMPQAMFIQSWPAAIIGVFLALMMLQSTTLCAQLIAESVSGWAYTAARKVLAVGLIVAACFALGEGAWRALDGSWQETLLAARRSTAAEIVLTPFSVFANVAFAQRFFPDALGWAALGGLMVVAIYALAVRLDANYLETAVRVSQQVQQRMRRAMSEGAFTAPLQGSAKSIWLSQPPRLGGLGPLVWMQAIRLMRAGRRVIIMTAVIMLAVSAPFVFRGHGAAQKELPAVLPYMIIGGAAYASFLMTSQSPLGFRADYERMDLLKSLPIRPSTMAWGQTFVLATVLTSLQWLVFAATGLFAPAAAAMLLLAGIFALPLNWILCGTENALSLLYPSPPTVIGSAGILNMGRIWLTMILKMLALLAATAIAAIPAAAVYLLSSSLVATALIAWLALLGVIVGILQIVAWAFQKYDVSAGALE